MSGDFTNLFKFHDQVIIFSSNTIAIHFHFSSPCILLDFPRFPSTATNYPRSFIRPKKDGEGGNLVYPLSFPPGCHSSSKETEIAGRGAPCPAGVWSGRKSARGISLSFSLSRPPYAQPTTHNIINNPWHSLFLPRPPASPVPSADCWLPSFFLPTPGAGPHYSLSRSLLIAVYYAYE